MITIGYNMITIPLQYFYNRLQYHYKKIKKLGLNNTQ